MRKQLSADDYVEGVRAGERAILARAITLIESRAPRHRALAREVLQRVLPFAGGAHRVGVTGSPGVGKSTFVEALGQQLLARGHKLAVLAIDPTSSLSGGSVLGDKTRMSLLSRDERAFIRPSPSSGTLGGVAQRTREAMLLCEAAGYDVVLVETVGVGQSETLVADMVDTFLLLLLAGAGDQLQGIKRGVLELADVLAITKADGENAERAARAAAEYRQALHLLRPRDPDWQPPLLLTSSLENSGIEALWEQVTAHRVSRQASGLWERHRATQRVGWLRGLVRDRLLEAFQEHSAVRSMLRPTEDEVEAGRLAPGLAAERLLGAFGLETKDDS